MVAVFLSYMEKAGHKIHREAFDKNLEDKFQDRRFKSDISPLLVYADGYDLETAASFVQKEILPLMPVALFVSN